MVQSVSQSVAEKPQYSVVYGPHGPVRPVAQRGLEFLHRRERSSASPC